MSRLLLALGTLLSLISPVVACGGKYRPLVLDVAEGSTILIVEGHKVRHEGGMPLTILEVLKGPAELDSCSISAETFLPGKAIVFVDFFQRQWDVYRTVPDGPHARNYLRGLGSIGPKDQVALARFALGFLDTKEEEVAGDVYFLLQNASDKTLRDALKDFPATKLRALIGNLRNPVQKRQICAYLLGHCGEPGDADFLAEALRSLPQGESSQAEGFIKGLTLLGPDKGWGIVLSWLGDKKKDYTSRHLALRVVRFFVETRPGHIPEKELKKAFAAVLGLEDMADFIMEDLGRWKNWSMTAEVLSLVGKTSHDTKLLRRAILRYALRCPEPSAAQFVAEQRSLDLLWVQQVEKTVRVADGN